ncbi:MAG: GT-D fold domain-containing protein [Butyrivibrio sp.]|nr:GT-D fold domain-containing protein [Butyrivibrio sp.]
MEKSVDEIISEVKELGKMNKGLQAGQQDMAQKLNELISLTEKQKTDIEVIKEYVYVNRARIESFPYEFRDKSYVSTVFIPKILSKHETRREVIDKKRSISRFGDGEFAVIAGIGRWNFQSASDILAAKLSKVLECNEEGLLIGLQRRFYGSLEDYTEKDADAVRAYMRPGIRLQHAGLLDPHRQYANTLMHEIANDIELAELKEVWDKRDCVFIEGRHTGMGVGNDLFDNCESIERILAPAENAIDRYDDIMNEALKQPKNKLFLIALGPTATALSYDLYKAGYQAVDIGHADLYYEKYVRNLDNLQDVSISYKYCNWDEVGKRREIEDITDETFCSQVVARVY